jgi:Fe-Mn family superoxide dismutase
MIHKLDPLPYAYNALEPYIDSNTMQIHHSRHHQTYVDKLNGALGGYPDLQKHGVETLLMNLIEIPEAIRSAVRNHGGGHANHSFFWPLLKTDVGFSGEVADAITHRFGSFDKFKADFSAAASLLFGSGWAWLVWHNKALEIMTTPNQDSPLIEQITPILGLDVWEHAYYLKYQNHRADYIESFFHIINWHRVNENFKSAKDRSS